MKLIIEKVGESAFRHIVMDGDIKKLEGTPCKLISKEAVEGLIAQISSFSDLDITEVENQLEN